jgi:Holliday junction DNA helicase RuvA
MFLFYNKFGVDCMYDYIKGIVTYIKNNAIVLDNNGIGYLIYVSNPYSFDIGVEYKVFVYQQIQEDGHFLYGFKSIEEKELFLKLISVKGLGCKMALPILAVGSIDGIMDAIERENILYLKKFPKIGDKLAKQIILDLKGKLEFIGVGISDEAVETENELKEVLIGLGYKEKEIKPVLSKVDTSLTIEEQVKDALKLLLK